MPSCTLYIGLANYSSANIQVGVQCSPRIIFRGDCPPALPSLQMLIVSPQIAYEGEAESMYSVFMKIVYKCYAVDESKPKWLGASHGKL